MRNFRGEEAIFFGPLPFVGACFGLSMIALVMEEIVVRYGQTVNGLQPDRVYTLADVGSGVPV